MKPAIAAAAVLALWVLTANACGNQTRFVLVPPTSSSSGGATVAPPPTEPAAPAAADDEAAIRDMLDRAFTLDPDVTFEERAAVVDGGDDLEPTYQALLDLVAGLDVEVRVDSISVTGADAATATVTVIVSGSEFAAGVPVALVRVDGAWKVTRGGACAVIALGVACPEQ